MEELGLENLSQDKKDELLSKMGELALKRMFVEVSDRLDDESRVHFEKMLEEERSPEEIEEFLNVKISDLDDILKKIAKDIKGEMIHE